MASPGAPRRACGAGRTTSCPRDEHLDRAQAIGLEGAGRAEVVDLAGGRTRPPFHRHFFGGAVGRSQPPPGARQRELTALLGGEGETGIARDVGEIGDPREDRPAALEVLEGGAFALDPAAAPEGNHGRSSGPVAMVRVSPGASSSQAGEAPPRGLRGHHQLRARGGEGSGGEMEAGQGRTRERGRGPGAFWAPWSLERSTIASY